MSRETILVWDVPTRVFHWLLVLCFVGAYLTAEADDWRLLHATLGFTLGALILFRLAWGVVGTRHARFADFRFGVPAVAGYLRSVVRGQPGHYAGHNPAGSWAIYAMLALGLGTALSGYALLNAIGGDFIEEAHETLGNAMLAIVVIHVLGVVVGSLVHHENLARGMLTGHKRGEPDQAITSPRPLVGLALLAAAIAFWVNALGVRDTLIGTPQQFAERQSEESHDD